MIHSNIAPASSITTSGHPSLRLARLLLSVAVILGSLVACGDSGEAGDSPPPSSSQSQPRDQAEAKATRSPEQLVEQLNRALDKQPADIGFWLRQVHTAEPAQAELLASMGTFYTAAAELDDEVRSRFGTGLGAGAVPTFPAGKVELGEISGSTGTLSMTSGGKVEPMKIVEADGRWMLAVDGLGDDFARSSEEMSGFAAMMADMTPIFSAVKEQAAQGAYASAGDVEQALQARMAEMMTGGVNAAGGGSEG